MSEPTPTERIFVLTWHCEKCGHNWTSRVQHSPIQCPNCKRRKWWERKHNDVQPQS